MIVLYADTSAVVGAYLADEPDHTTLASLLFDGADAVVTSELTRVEFASATAAAARAGRLNRAGELRDRFDLDCGEDGPVSLLRLDATEALPIARDLVGRHRLRTLDALHLAVALTAAQALADDVVMLTRDVRQSCAARELGLAVR
ncbi:MAG: type II toxin-antitoxin system VapC family toxin [Pseudonocardia sp.]|nr:type II toxin-antitoxin system VapC family toxin [Pseudonocardia sp.]